MPAPQNGRERERPSILQRAVGMLARRDYSRAELTRKLRRHLTDAEDPEDIARALDRLQAQGMLSDDRFAATLARVRAGRYGVLRVARELKEHAIDADTVQRLSAELGGSEYERACAVRERKFGATLPADAKSRTRQMRFLAARGFAADVILRVVGKHRAKRDLEG